MIIPLTFRRSRADSNRRPHLASGFTLTEILIAIALIVTIVAVAVTNLGTLLTGGQRQAAQVFVTDGINTPLMSYKIAVGHFPTNDQGLKALIMAPDGESGWHGPYLSDTIKDTPKDPWGNYYQYQFPGPHNPNSSDVWSMGPDGQNGTADDVGNWPAQ